MNRLSLTFALLFALLLSMATNFHTYAGRPNPPGIRGSVLILDPLALTLPHVRVLDERGRVVADVEVVRNGSSGLFDIPLKKAGAYVVWAYQPPFPGDLRTYPVLVDIPRKEFVAVTLQWQPN